MMPAFGYARSNHTFKEKNMLKTTVAALCLVGCVALTGCKSNDNNNDDVMMEAGGEPMANTECYCGGPAKESVTTVSKDGEKVGFCCSECRKEFGSMSKSEQNKKLANSR